MQSTYAYPLLKPLPSYEPAGVVLPLLPFSSFPSSVPSPLPLLNQKQAFAVKEQRSGNALGTLPMARNVYNAFDFDSIPSGKFANLSIQDITIQAMLLMIYAPETYMAFKSDKHPYETLGRNVLSWTFRLGLMVFTKNNKFSVNSWFLDSAIQNKHLAQKKEVNTLGEFVGKFWHNHVNTPIQAKFGLDGDFLNEVLRPSGLKVKEKDRFAVKWAGYKGNEEGCIHIMEQRYKLNSLGHLFENKALAVIEDKAKLTPTLQELTAEAYKQMHVLARDISPSNTVNEAAQDVMSGLFHSFTTEATTVEKSLKLQQEAGHKFSKLFHLYQAHEPLEADKAASAFRQMVREAMLEDPMQAKALASKKLNIWLKQANEGWRQTLEQPIVEAIEQMTDKFKETVAEGQRMKPLNLGREPLKTLAKESWKTLLKLSPQEGGLQKVEGKLAHLLEPMMQLSHRLNMTRAFLDRRKVFMGVQIAFITALNAVLIGQLMMVLVFNTFARMDHDFDPSRFKNKKKLYKEQHQPKAAPSTAMPQKQDTASQVASLSKTTQLPVPPLSSTKTVYPLAPSLSTPLGFTAFNSPFLSPSSPAL